MSDTVDNRTMLEAEDWQKARTRLLDAEKALTAEHDD